VDGNGDVDVGEWERAISNALKNVDADTAGADAFKITRVRAKILLGHLQQLAAVGVVYLVDWPAALLRLISAIDVLNIRLLTIPGLTYTCVAPAVGFYEYYVLGVAVLPLVILALFAVFGLGKVGMCLIGARSVDKQFFDDKMYEGAFWCLLLVFPSASRISLELYNCAPLDDSYYLVADPSVPCYDRAHNAYQLYGTVALLVYPIGIPCIVAWLLATKRKLGTPRLGWAHRLQVLTDGYRDACAGWYEAYALCRQLVMCAGMIFVVPTTITQLAVGALVTAVALGFEARVAAHEGRSENVLAVLGLGSQGLTLLAGLVIKSKALFADGLDAKGERWLAVAVAGTNYLVLAVLAGAVLWSAAAAVAPARLPFSDTCAKTRPAGEAELDADAKAEAEAAAFDLDGPGAAPLRARLVEQSRVLRCTRQKCDTLRERHRVQLRLESEAAASHQRETAAVVAELEKELADVRKRRREAEAFETAPLRPVRRIREANAAGAGGAMAGGGTPTRRPERSPRRVVEAASVAAEASDRGADEPPRPPPPPPPPAAATRTVRDSEAIAFGEWIDSVLVDERLGKGKLEPGGAGGSYRL